MYPFKFCAHLSSVKRYIDQLPIIVRGWLSRAWVLRNVVYMSGVHRRHCVPAIHVHKSREVLCEQKGLFVPPATEVHSGGVCMV